MYIQIKVYFFIFIFIYPPHLIITQMPITVNVNDIFPDETVEFIEFDKLFDQEKCENPQFQIHYTTGQLR